MRIIAGEWRARTIVAPDGDMTRPTADRTRETLFSMLVSRLGSFEGLRVGDLFAGSGALGLEALSRGAASCLFVEQAPPAIRAIRANVARLQAQARCDIRASSVMALGPVREPLDLVLLDPPYGTGAGAVAIEKLHRLGWIGPGTWISLETAVIEDPRVRGFAAEVDRKVGKAKLTLFRMVGVDAPELPGEPATEPES
jgi:16S rRNA (guanine966-N2)-methyltransferase